MSAVTEPRVAVQAEDVGAFGIAVEALSARYGHTLAIRNLSLHVPRGAIYGLIGPSGAGKSTLLRILATAQAPDSGLVWMDGIDLRADPGGARRRIGYLPDSAGMYDAFTVREYLNFYAGLFQVPARLRRQSTDELLELFDLSEQRNRPVYTLSRGRRQQLGMARCLVHDPSILLLDEPAAGMDPRFRLELRDILMELARFGKTILIASNLLSELVSVCTHLGFMDNGQLFIQGEMDEVMHAVATEALLHVVLLDAHGRDAACAVLESHSVIGAVELLDDSELRVQFSGTRHDLASVLEALLARGIAVTQFTLEHQRLEDVFFRIDATRNRE